MDTVPILVSAKAIDLFVVQPFSALDRTLTSSLRAKHDLASYLHFFCALQRPTSRHPIVLNTAPLPTTRPRLRLVVIRLGLVLLGLEVGVVVVGHIEVAVSERRCLERRFFPRSIVDILWKLAVFAEAERVGLLRRGRRADGERDGRLLLLGKRLDKGR